MTEKLRFRISSALKDVIGKDLITDDFVAVFELIKNAFDAFAKNVTIHFMLDEGQNNRIFIIDDGKGMSKQDLIEKWLFVAFSAKKDGTEDKNKRVYSGYKGIGRFSSDRLGRTLRIQAKTKLDNSINCINVNWDDFEINSKDEFINVDVGYSEKSSFQLPKGITKHDSGVVLEIGFLRDEVSWNRDKLIKLKTSLQKLIDPISNTKEIEIKCSREIKNDLIEKQKNKNPIIINEIINNTILETLEGKTTKIKAQITNQGILQVELVDRGTFIYKTEENISDVFPELLCSDFYLELFFLNLAAKNTFTRRMGIRAVDYGSLLLIRNDFRVFPIGEEYDDYWGLARRKQQGYARFLGNRDIFGCVKISGSEDKFRESSSRNQGLIQNKAAKELNDCVLKCIKKFEAYVVDVTWKDKLDKENTNFERMGLDNNRYNIIGLIEKLSKSKNIKVIDYNHNLVSILNEKAKEFEPSLTKLQSIADSLNDKELIKQISFAEKALLKAKIAEQEAEKNAEQERQARKKAEEKAQKATDIAEAITIEKAMFKNAYDEEVKRNLFLSGSGSRDKELLEGFIHQIVLYASESKGILQNILQFPENLKELSIKELKELFTNLFEVNEKIISTSRFATTANFRMKSSMITEDVNAFIREYLDKIASAYNSRIKIVSEIDSSIFEFAFNPIEMGMLLENFISNSKNARASSITFKTTTTAKVFYLVIEDNGKGIDKQITEKKLIFEKGFTRTDGSGLGLYFCKNQVEKFGGELKLSKVQPNRGISFTIRMAK